MGAGAEAARVELACLELREQRYGVDVLQVREIVRAQRPTPLPGAPALVEGVIDLRGTLVPVIDLGRALGGARSTDGPGARIAIVEAEGLAFGLAADGASEVLAVAASDLQDPPGLVTQAGYRFVKAMVRRESAAPVLVLALEDVLERVFRGGGSAEGERSNEGR